MAITINNNELIFMSIFFPTLVVTFLILIFYPSESSVIEKLKKLKK